MTINLKKILSKRHKTRYWLCKNTGLSQATINALYSSQAKLIHFSVLEKICHALNCTPNDLLEIEKEE